MDPNNWLSENEKEESQKLWEERMAVIKNTATIAFSDSLKHLWLSGKLYDDMDRNPRAYGNRSLEELAADLHCKVEHLPWRRQLYEEYTEAAIDDLAKSGLAWCDVFALLHFHDPAERESARVRLVAKKIDWREACEEGERAKLREKARQLKERNLALEKKTRDEFNKDPSAHVKQIFRSCITQLSDTIYILNRICRADQRYRQMVETMGFGHRLQILTRRHACVEAISYYSKVFADAANRIAFLAADQLPNVTQLSPLPPLSDTTGLWRDLHDLKPQLERKSTGTGYTAICKEFQAFQGYAPSMVERLASVHWGIALLPKMPEQGRQLCINELVGVHKALVIIQRKLGEFRTELTQ